VESQTPTASIENDLARKVQRLELQLSEAHQREAATAEVLKIISRSPSQLQPVFDFIARSASRLCGDEHAIVTRYDGIDVYLVAQHNPRPGTLSEVAQNYPARAARSTLVGVRAVATASVIHIPDVDAAEYDAFDASDLERYRRISARALIGVPMIHQGRPIGSIAVSRATPGPFSERQIELLKTFADQAVIAIENTRLFEEVQSRNRDLTALGEVGRAVSSTLDLKAVLKTIVDRAVELSGTAGGSIFYFREDIGKFELGQTTGLAEEVVARFRKLDIAARQTGLGEAIAKRQPLQVPDVQGRASNPLRDAAIEAGLRAALIVPLFSGDSPLRRAGAATAAARRLRAGRGQSHAELC